MERWLVIHIMKTAGTSLRQALLAADPARVYPLNPDMRRVGRNLFYHHAPEVLADLSARPELAAERQVFFGHFPAVIRDHLPFPVKTAVFLRDPLARSVSMINHRRRALPRGQRQRPDRAFLTDPAFLAREIRDYQTKVFAIDDVAVTPEATAELDEAAFARALARLEACEFVGITEEMERSMALLRAVSGLPLPEELPRENVAATRRSRLQRVPILGRYVGFSVSRPSGLTPEDRAVILRETALDRRLYAAATRLFEDRAAAALHAKGA